MFFIHNIEIPEIICPSASPIANASFVQYGNGIGNATQYRCDPGFAANTSSGVATTFNRTCVTNPDGVTADWSGAYQCSGDCAHIFV